MNKIVKIGFKRTDTFHIYHFNNLQIIQRLNKIVKIGFKRTDTFDIYHLNNLQIIQRLNKRLLKWDLKDLIFTSIFKTFQKCELFLKKERD